MYIIQTSGLYGHNAHISWVLAPCSTSSRPYSKSSYSNECKSFVYSTDNSPLSVTKEVGGVVILITEWAETEANHPKYFLSNWLTGMLSLWPNKVPVKRVQREENTDINVCLSSELAELNWSGRPTSCDNTQRENLQFDRSYFCTEVVYMPVLQTCFSPSQQLLWNIDIFTFLRN